MNRKIGMIGSGINCISVCLFAVSMLLGFDFGGYFVCMILAIGFIMMIGAFSNECEPDKKSAANTAMIFTSMYAMFIFVVYFAQTTSVRLDNLSTQTLQVLDYSKSGLFFNYDLIGYGMMALATFFIGLTIKTDNKADKGLKWLLIIHGLFFITCFIMPMCGVFSSESNQGRMAGVIALEFWCSYFIPVGILSWLHFSKSKKA